MFMHTQMCAHADTHKMIAHPYMRKHIFSWQSNIALFAFLTCNKRTDCGSGWSMGCEDSHAGKLCRPVMYCSNARSSADDSARTSAFMCEANGEPASKPTNTSSRQTTSASITAMRYK